MSKEKSERDKLIDELEREPEVRVEWRTHGRLSLSSRELEDIRIRAMMETQYNIDPGYCGLGRWTLGKWDPLWEACKLAHDPTFDDLLVGKITNSQLGTLGSFGKALAKKWGNAARNPFSAKAVYTLVAAPLYFLFGGVLGMLRYRQLIKSGMVKQDPDSGEMY